MYRLIFSLPLSKNQIFSKSECQYLVVTKVAMCTKIDVKNEARTTDVYDIEVARFKILNLPWFDAYVNLYWYFYSLLEICC